MWHVWERGEFHRGLWWGDLKERRHFKGPGIKLVGNVKMDLENGIGLVVD